MKRILAYEASAGTGKTFALVTRYLSLLFMGASPSSILALTFTNKAANEMRERIVSRLENLEESPELAQIESITQMGREEILKLAPRVSEKFLNAEVKISTIDSFFLSVLRSFFMYAGLRFDFSIEPDEKEELLYRFLGAVRALGKSENMIRVALSARGGVDRALGTIESIYSFNAADLRVSKSETKKEELAKEIEKELRFLREWIESCEEASSMAKKALMVNTPQEILEKTWIKKESLQDYRYFKKCYRNEADDIFFRLKALMGEYLKSSEKELLNDFLDLALLYKETRKKLKRDSNTLSFEDLPLFLADLLRGKIKNDFLYFRLDSRIDHILIDEFQDTSILQYRILEPLIEEICSGAGSKEFRSFFYVGDTKQSIYRFRGGYKDLFGYVAERFDIEVIPMEVNYRSARNIVEFVNETFSPLYKEDGYVMQKAASKDEGYVEVIYGEDIPKSVVETVVSLKNKGVRYGDMAILCFKNEDVEIIKDHLQKSLPDVRISTVTTARLLAKDNVKAVCKFFEYLHYGEDIFKAAFLSLIGIDPTEKIDSKKYEHLLSSPLQLLKRVCADFGIDCKDDNMLAFMEILSGYGDIAEFVSNMERIDAVAVSGAEEGIKIMTIHKSKGLEFEHLVLCDRLSRRAPDTSSLILDREGPRIRGVFKKIQNREYVDREYAAALEKEKEESELERINLLYVAMTRAKNSLNIVASKNGEFGSIGLKEGKRGELKSSRTEDRTALVRLYPKEINVARQKIETQNEKTDIKTKEIIFGTALHYALEVADLRSPNIESSIHSVKNRFGFYLEDFEIEDIKCRIERLMDDPFFNELVSFGDLFVEQQLAYGDKILQPDLFIVKDKECLIVDYKTSKESRSDHIRQIREYSRALEDILERGTRGYLCYLHATGPEWLEV